MRISRMALFLLGLSTAAAGQEVGDRAAGRRLAESVCNRCHGAASAATPAPAFSTIAAIPTTDARALRVFLRTSHAKMPNFELTETERDDVIAYILSLKP